MAQANQELMELEVCVPQNRNHVVNEKANIFILYKKKEQSNAYGVCEERAVAASSKTKGDEDYRLQWHGIKWSKQHASNYTNKTKWI